MPQEQAAVYANRRRIRGDRGKGLLKQRGEKIERSFAHLYETGGLRRVHLRQHPNILKRLLVHGAAFNLGLMMRKIFGKGTPRGLPGDRAELFLAFWRLLSEAWSAAMTSPILWGAPGEHPPRFQPSGSTISGPLEMSISTTGCYDSIAIKLDRTSQ
jgi:transposase